MHSTKKCVAATSKKVVTTTTSSWLTVWQSVFCVTCQTLIYTDKLFVYNCRV